MKRRIISIFCAVLLAISMVGSITAYALGNEYYYVTVTTCKVRSTPSTSGTVLATLSAGTHKQDYYLNHPSQVWFYSTTDWSPVLQNGSLGYIRNDLVCPLDRAYYVNTSSGLCLRPAPTTASSSNKYLGYYDIVSSLGHSSYADGYLWYEVVVMTGTYEGYTGWVAYTYLTTYSH